MTDYAIKVLRAGDGEYVAVVPDLPGCSASGATPAEALWKAEIASRLWIAVAQARGEPVPEPSWRPDPPAER